jgi:hypothetical protein
VKCHQRIIREEQALVDPQPVEQSLAGSRVEQITRAEAATVILQYEWLGTMPKIGQAYYGLRTASDRLAGVACFGIGPHSHSAMFCGPENAQNIRCLERGACTHWAHPHSGSFLVAGACKAAHRDHGWVGFFAYSDVEAGEIGTIYQACNWLYLGQGVGRPGARNKYLKPDGTVISSRVMRDMVRKAHGTDIPTSWHLYEAQGWAKGKEYPKHKYVHFEGDRKTRAALRKALQHPVLPYPKRVNAVLIPQGL